MIMSSADGDGDIVMAMSFGDLGGGESMVVLDL